MERIIMYCDGGCRGNQVKENIGAWAYTLNYKGRIKEGSAYAYNTTNNKMELQACIEGLRAIKNKEIGIDVHLDSNYVLQGITSWIHNWKKKNWVKSDKKPVENKELWVELDALKSQFKDIQFIKVKGHSGDIGNDRVDELCNKRMDEIS